MQIFVTNSNPYKSAYRLQRNKKRAYKMITESMQILACCQKHYNNEPKIKKVNGEPYSTPKSRMNHPVVLWAYADKMHMLWLIHHAFHLFNFYLKQCARDNKQPKFSNIQDNLDILIDQGCSCDFEKVKFLNFAKAENKGLDYTDEPDVFKAYDKFLTAQGD